MGNVTCISICSIKLQVQFWGCASLAKNFSSAALSLGLRRFLFVRTDRQDHCRTSQLANEIGFFQSFFFEKPSLIGFDWSGWIVFIKSEIFITTGMAWPVSSDTWKVPSVSAEGVSLRPRFSTRGWGVPAIEIYANLSKSALWRSAVFYALRSTKRTSKNKPCKK